MPENLISQLERDYPEIWQCLREIEDKYRAHGHQLYLVGGAVRNLVLGVPLKDFDLCTNALPEQTIRMFRSVIPTGIQHGTVTLVFRKHHFEITTFRLDGAYTDARRPDSVAFTPDILEDLKRRDFTINAMALQLGERRLIDPHGGRLDLTRRLIRTVGVARERFNEDGLRIMRGLRFAAQLGFAIETATWEAMGERLEKLAKVSVERFRDELLRTLEAPLPSRGLYLMRRTGALDLFLPGLSAQTETDFARTCLAADILPARPAELRLAALFSGSPVARAKELLAGLRLSNAGVKLVELLLGLLDQRYDSTWSDADLRRMAARAGRSNIPCAVASLNAQTLARDWLDYNPAEQPALVPVAPPELDGTDLSALDCTPAWATRIDGLRALPDPLCRELAGRMEAIRQGDNALTIAELRVDGKRLQAAGIPPSRALGTILGKLLDEVLEEPARNETGSLVERAKTLWAEMDQEPGKSVS